MNLKDMTTLELRELIARAKSALIDREKADKEQALAQIHAIAKEAGVPLKELVKGLAGKSVKAVAPRYRNPADASQVWTGRGIAPKWARSYQAAGTLDTTLIVPEA
jgi:DNA-binding protein H-NS